MRRHKREFSLIGLVLPLLLLTAAAAADGNFEDADKATSGTEEGEQQQEYDLRHTIPGEPGVDYPIYSEVPPTSFECSGKHEGYYADVESRCQAFRICTNTARSTQGFGFLCPNGTLFSQRHFVCDWYRNVNCEESEQYYNKNDINRIGDSSDMLEVVRHMMEYPMKTITKALQQPSSSSSSRRPTTSSSSGGSGGRGRGAARHNSSGSSVSSSTGDGVTEASAGGNTPDQALAQQTGSGRKAAVTRAQVESAYNYANKIEKRGRGRGSSGGATRQPARSGAAAHKGAESEAQETTVSGSTRSASVAATAPPLAQTEADDADVYVNSLGELSTDPGANFDRNKATIIAESSTQQDQDEQGEQQEQEQEQQQEQKDEQDEEQDQQQQQQLKRMNFAEKVNAGLNDLAELPADEVLAPDYVKTMRHGGQADEHVSLAANVNGLLDEIESEVDPNVAGYQLPAPQKTKHAFRFLSRGFSSQGERAKEAAYSYGKPKQTPNTVRFTPNELPIEPYKKSSSAAAYEQKPVAQDVAIVATTTIATPIYDTTLTAPTTPSAIYTTTINTNTNSYYMTTLTPDTPLDTHAPSNYDDGYVADTTPTYLPPTTAIVVEDEEQGQAEGIEGVAPLQLIATLPPYEDAVPATTTTATLSSIDEQAAEGAWPPTTTMTTSTVAAGGEEVDATTAATATSTTPISTTTELDEEALEAQADKQAANQQAASLLLAGLQLSAHERRPGASPSLLIQVADDPLQWSASTAAAGYLPAVTEPSSFGGDIGALARHNGGDAANGGGSFQERIRSYRRYANIQRASAKPLIYGKRAQVQALPRPGSNTPATPSLHAAIATYTTTPRPSTSSVSSTAGSTTTTRSYLKRVAASRLRLSRLASARTSATTTSTTPSTPLSGADTLSLLDNNNSIDAVGDSVITWESVRKNLQRFQVSGRKRNNNNTYGSNISPATATTTPPTTSSAHQRNAAATRTRSRYSNYSKSQQQQQQQQQQRASAAATAKTTTTSTPVVTAPAPPLQHLTAALKAPTYSTAFSTSLHSMVPSASSLTSSSLQSSSPSLSSSSSPSASSSSTSSSSSSSSLQALLNAIPKSIASQYAVVAATTATTAATSTTSRPSLSLSAPAFTSSSPSSSVSLSSASSSPTSSGASHYLSFDALTRSILDDSVLQNYRGAQAIGRHSTPYQPGQQQQQQQQSQLQQQQQLQRLQKEKEQLQQQLQQQKLQQQRLQQQQLEQQQRQRQQQQQQLEQQRQQQQQQQKLEQQRLQQQQQQQQQLERQRQQQQQQQQQSTHTQTHNFVKIPAQSPTQLTPPPRPQHLPVPPVAALPAAPAGPHIAVARAEGQRIEANSISSIISSLVLPQAKPKATNGAYVPLNDFLTKKFGNGNDNNSNQQQPHQAQQQYQQATSNFNYNVPQQQQQQITYSTQYQHQQQQQQQQQQPNYYQPIAATQNVYSSQQQQPQASQQQQQPFVTQNIVADLLQQQKTLPQFPPLGVQPTAAGVAATTPATYYNNNKMDFVNVPLPTQGAAGGALTIPAPTTATNAAALNSFYTTNNNNYNNNNIK